MSPLQLALAYSALVNGGTHLAADARLGASSTPHGKVVEKITPKVRNRVPVSQSAARLHRQVAGLQPRLGGVRRVRLHRLAVSQSRIGGKTGTAEVYGKQDTSWLASWGPTYKEHGTTSARFVVVGMVEQAGTGATAAGADAQASLGRHVRRRRHAGHLPDARPRAAAPTLPQRRAGRPPDERSPPRDPRAPFALTPPRHAARAPGAAATTRRSRCCALALCAASARVLVWAATRDVQRAAGGRPAALPVPASDQHRDRRRC